MKNNHLAAAAAEWLNKADDDLLSARTLLREERVYGNVCALAEQAVEKTIKAYIVKKAGGIAREERTHNIVELARRCFELGLNLKKFQKDLRWFSDIYIPSRYPTPLNPRFNKRDAEQALEKANKIIEIARKAIFKKI